MKIDLNHIQNKEFICENSENDFRVYKFRFFEQSNNSKLRKTRATSETNGLHSKLFYEENHYL